MAQAEILTARILRIFYRARKPQPEVFRPFVFLPDLF
jgi:hypothetical protein